MKTRELSAAWPAHITLRTNPLLLFARNFFKHPKMLGTPIPSSQRLIDGVLKPVIWPETKLVVEYGPGVGSITMEILRRMQPDATLIAIETNADFVEYLGSTVNDSRLRVVHGSAEQTGELLARMRFGPADCVVSGIPFSTMPRSSRESILQVTRDALRPKGQFLVYQYSQRIFPSLKKFFGEVRRDFLMAKMVPLWLFNCSR